MENLNEIGTIVSKFENFYFIPLEFNPNKDKFPFTTKELEESWFGVKIDLRGCIRFVPESYLEKFKEN